MPIENEQEDLLLLLDDDEDIQLEADDEEDLILEDSSADYQLYGGPYTVTPLLDEEQVLTTGHKLMRSDVTVGPIPIMREDNTAGGVTVIIGDDDPDTATGTHVNKVMLSDNTVLIDLSGDTATADKVIDGYTIHDASGAQVTGNVGAGVITNNVSGWPSTGMINRGNQVKIGAGYYSDDLYYTAQSNSGTKDITSSGITSVDGYESVNVQKGAIVLSIPATQNTSVSISNNDITENHIVYTQTSTEPDADVSWDTYDGLVTLTCSTGIPAMTILLCLDI